ncbi:hypothetical protein [Actomonas aquatica]|uniref:CHAT domain-containing protein n=1 Tax=Actomonas aquatica TaxID=2866162 RepID=A0ABZ1CCM2_9BACT|nr:hypothetical protein [Opitutus sp. WL0086]WRQ88050.1 hypothetical protein K1X11_001440 [Opitutus sp. WL0086]
MKSTTVSIKESVTIPLHLSDTEVFILESLAVDDEKADRYEGKILEQMLRMCGKAPVYYYFRTKLEFIELLKEFQKSSYRYLHLSCHASPTEIYTTYETIPLSEFCSILGSHLKNRRFFMSACEIGNNIASTAMFGTSKGMYSFAAPAEKIRFDHAAALWSAFYVRTGDLHVEKKKKRSNGDVTKIVSLNIQAINETLQKLCDLFGVSFYSAWYDPRADQQKVVDISIAPSVPSTIKKATGPMKDC